MDFICETHSSLPHNRHSAVVTPKEQTIKKDQNCLMNGQFSQRSWGRNLLGSVLLGVPGRGFRAPGHMKHLPAPPWFPGVPPGMGECPRSYFDVCVSLEIESQI